MPRAKREPITAERILELKERNPDMTLQEAAKILQCTHANIVQHLKRAGKKWSTVTEVTEEVQQFKSKRAELLASVQKRILSTISDEELKKASLKDKVWCFGVLFDKERIERGKSIDEKALYVVLVERSFRQNYLEGGAKIIDAEATDTGQRSIGQYTTAEKDKEGQEVTDDNQS